MLSFNPVSFIKSNQIKKESKIENNIKMNLKLLFFLLLILVTVQQCLTEEGKDKNPAQKKVIIT
jgi:hypothetical protein